MACTAKMPLGKADITGISLTTLVGKQVVGPPAYGAASTEGVYEVQASPGASATLRWLFDRPVTAGTASTSTFANANA
jgi:hypothetical protein